MEQVKVSNDPEGFVQLHGGPLDGLMVGLPDCVGVVQVHGYFYRLDGGKWRHVRADNFHDAMERTL